MNKYLNIKHVEALPDYRVLLTLVDGRTGCFDVKPYLNNGVFCELKNKKMFNTVKVYFGDSISWANEADIAPERLFEEIKFN